MDENKDFFGFGTKQVHITKEVTNAEVQAVAMKFPDEVKMSRKDNNSSEDDSNIEKSTNSLEKNSSPDPDNSEK